MSRYAAVARLVTNALFVLRCSDPRLGRAAVDQPFIGLRGKQREDCPLLFAQVTRSVGDAALGRRIFGTNRAHHLHRLAAERIAIRAEGAAKRIIAVDRNRVPLLSSE